MGCHKYAFTTRLEGRIMGSLINKYICSIAWTWWTTSHFCRSARRFLSRPSSNGVLRNGWPFNDLDFDQQINLSLLAHPSVNAQRFIPGRVYPSHETSSGPFIDVDMFIHVDCFSYSNLPRPRSLCVGFVRRFQRHETLIRMSL